MSTVISIICVLFLGGIALYAIEHRQVTVIYYKKEKPLGGRIKQNRDEIAAQLGKII